MASAAESPDIWQAGAPAGRSNRSSQRTTHLNRHDCLVASLRILLLRDCAVGIDDERDGTCVRMQKGVFLSEFLSCKVNVRNDGLGGHKCFDFQLC